VELQREGFLCHWAYRQAADAQEWVMVYWPGETFVHDQEARTAHRQRTAPQAVAPLRVPTAQRALIEKVASYQRTSGGTGHGGHARPLA
jgi:hypothetical protein